MNEHWFFYIIRARISGFWKRAAFVLSCFVVFVTTYLLILPAITLERPAESGGRGVLVCEGTDYKALAFFDREAGIPSDAVLSVTEIPREQAAGEEYYEQAQRMVCSGDGRSVSWARVFDINIQKDGRRIEPSAPVEVRIAYRDPVRKTGDGEVSTIHFTGKEELPALVPTRTTGTEDTVEQVCFEADSFSIYVVIGTTIEKTVLASDGNNYRISVTYGEEAGVPEGAQLDVREITKEDGGEEEGTSEYDDYVAKTENVLGISEGGADYIRLFDIRIVDENGEKVEISAPVDVKISLADRTDAESAAAATQVVHFADDEDEGEVVENVEVDPAGSEEEGVSYSFEASGFSVYAIVDAPEPAQQEIETISSLRELAEKAGHPSEAGEDADAGEGFCLSVTRSGSTTYFLSSMNDKDCYQLGADVATAAVWYFQAVEGQAGRYRIFTIVGGSRLYMKQKSASGNEMSLTDGEGTVFEVSEAGGGTFYLKCADQNRWLQYSKSGGGIRLWTDKNNTENSRITLTLASSVLPEKDPYHLDGKKYGIAYHDDTAAAAALSLQSAAISANVTGLAAQDMLMRPDVLNNDGILLVAQNSSLAEWTFESVTADRYYLTAMDGGNKKYLTVRGTNVTLEDAPDETFSVVTAVPGTGEYKGKWRFFVDGKNLSANLSGNTARGFCGNTGTGKTAWLNLVERSVLEDDDFHLYLAKKVSVSDTANVYDGQQVVIYTRIWNDTVGKYEFYLVDHDGSLVRCYDTGDGIEWTGSRVNTALWEFTDYLNADGTPTYYYELRNTQYGGYLAPLAAAGKVLSDDTVGINLNGRRYGDTYTTIIAWDDDSYAYTGLKTAGGKAVAGPLSEADDFYFAVVNPVETADKLTTVKTIDNAKFGITMKMTDFNNPIKGDRDSGQASFMGAQTGKGLLSTDLGDDGYPTGTAKAGKEGNGQSLRILYEEKSTGLQEATHLFIESIYNESGYFEYDSTQNFAHLNEDGTFTVYDQLGAITGNSERKLTRTHGQFMPYNSITAGDFAVGADGEYITNLTDVLATELPDLNPRKGERMYRIGDSSEVDYFFGMEMEAGFTQTASGLDAWGHDIIFEFSGDDDFWLYVDGELVIDLGGIHSAQVGTVNFRTGVITSSNGDSTLYDTFRNNYRQRGMEESEISEKLEEIFERNEDGRYIFRDYTNHSMKIFYMERGAGASNLHMRFNLAAVKPGSFILSKRLSGTDSPANDMIEFPYQIRYTSKKDGQEHLLGEEAGDTDRVKYEGTNSSVTYKEQFTPADGTQPYEHVFFLRPGQSAEVAMPEDVISYYVVECGVNPDVYDEVKANDIALPGTDTGNSVGTTARKDYATEPASMEERSRVDYDNHVSEGAMRALTVRKKLYDSDGQTLLSSAQDDTMFTFRLYLGTENADRDNLPAANLYSYYVKDPDGYYCSWDSEQQRFVSLRYDTFSALSEYLDGLTSAERETVVFVTSMNGTVSKIPADYTVEVRDLIVGTQFKVEERSGEIPKGYTLRLSDGYTRIDTDPVISQYEPLSGVVQVNSDPALEVRNQKGWGLTVRKIWTDKDFMAEHDGIFFAVYLKNFEGFPGELLEGTVRQLPAGETELYYYFEQLDSNRPFSDYIVREVTLTPGAGGYSVDEAGTVTGDFSAVPIEEGGKLTIGGRPVGGEYSANAYAYTVGYETGKQTTKNENVRTDTVTDSRPGFELYKQDWNGENLAGAVFTLVDAAGRDVAAPSYTSAANGLITTAYLSAGSYTLTETAAPKGYVVMDKPMTITVGEDGSIQAGGPDSSLYELEMLRDGSMAARITIKDRPGTFRVKKVDPVENTPVGGACFALYPQVKDMDGTLRRDYQPVPGYERLVTDGNGILPSVSMELKAGTYYLTEIQAAEGYQPLTEDLCFSIGKDGKVEIVDEQFRNWLKQTADPETGRVSYTIEIPNKKGERVRIRKLSTDTGRALEGVTFALYTADGFDDGANRPRDGAVPLFEGTTDTEGVLELGLLTAGQYRLAETMAPEGYLLPDAPVRIIINENGMVTAIQGTTQIQADKLNNTWLLTVFNSPGYALPATGGPGTRQICTIGVLLVLAGLAGVLRNRVRQ